MYSCDESKRYLLEDAGWRRDIVPEIMDGHNIADFVDPDIDAKLEALEREEDAALARFEASVCAPAVHLLRHHTALHKITTIADNECQSEQSVACGHIELLTRSVCTSTCVQG